MRLTKIKLAGFKSFVDPTTVHLKSNLVGVIGPNGSGKSNIIDAVRWVMGESSAKHLRGDSMADVIFNGSSGRKPVGQASIELVFDNSKAIMGGQFASFSEISVKRLVSRDGQSIYFLNSSRCRRKDITDLFLGTGLGPRSYAIIEQGMISRLIEAKPEALRATIEEAAGISKYKERRRETETRIRHTQDNLSRINDLRDELGRQLEKLQRQAQTANRYKALKQEEREVKGQLLALQWQEMDAKAREKEALVMRNETQLEAELANQRSLEASIEKQREAHGEASEIFNEVQAQYYQIGSEIAAKEQGIQHANERRQQFEQDLAQVEHSLEQSRSHHHSDQEKLVTLENQLAELQPIYEQASESSDIARARFEEAEAAMHAWQSEWDQFTQQSAESTKAAEVERTRIDHMEQQSRQLELRYKRLQDEFQALESTELEQEIGELSEQVLILQAQAEDQLLALQACQENLSQQQKENSELNDSLTETRSKVQRLAGRVVSLETLQEAALGKDEKASKAWLEQQGLASHSRLAQCLEVDDGWEKAVETVLDFHLEAICVDSANDYAEVLLNFNDGAIELFQKDSAEFEQVLTDKGVSTLASKVRSELPLQGILNNIYCAENSEQALAMQANLRSSESIVVRDGSWVGKQWLRNHKKNLEKRGVIQREKELKQIQHELQLDQQRVQSLDDDFQQGKTKLQQWEQQRTELQQALGQLERQLGENKAQLSGKQARHEQLLSRRERLATDMEELQSHLQENLESIATARGRLEQSLETMEEQAQRKQNMQSHREEIRNTLEQARASSQQQRQHLHELRVEMQTRKTAIDSTRQSLNRAASQLDGLISRQETLEKALMENEQPVATYQQELERLLASRGEIESRLSETRREVEAIDEAMRASASKRSEIEQAVQSAREALEQVRIDAQTLKIRRQTLQEQLTQSDFELKAIFDNMPSQASIKSWEQRLIQLEQKIQRLGLINLAAIDEYEEQSQRKDHIEAQYNDLIEALTTLENAIRKIDRETRARFKETFDLVNNGLKKTFPKLFGGGQAYLELTGDDLLDTGVSIMARPPGKRVSNIHLLSGGEKALTAVALVFSIFELNPAPFCMLDEVDAPLDEANVGRFCDLVREMSEQVQFIFITHNKATMEISSHLNGVTMHEPGVSRMVAVDVEEAVELAAI